MGLSPPIQALLALNNTRVQQVSIDLTTKLLPVLNEIADLLRTTNNHLEYTDPVTGTATAVLDLTYLLLKRVLTQDNGFSYVQGIATEIANINRDNYLHVPGSLPVLYAALNNAKNVEILAATQTGANLVSSIDVALNSVIASVPLVGSALKTFTVAV